jgi:hypothetical protein
MRRIERDELTLDDNHAGVIDGPAPGAHPATSSVIRAHGAPGLGDFARLADQAFQHLHDLYAPLSAHDQTCAMPQ